MATTYDDTHFREVFDREFTYIAGFVRNTHRFADRPAISDPLTGRTLSYAELDREVNRLANALLADGVGCGDVVMFQLFNCLEFALLYLAPKKIGAVSCPINFRLAYGETAAIVDDSKPAVFFFDTSLRESVGRALAMARHNPRRVIAVNPSGKGVAVTETGFARYVEGADECPPPLANPSTAYEETTRLYTTGPSGEPRGVPLNNITEILSAHDVMMHFPLSPLDATLNMTPWFHRGGLYSGGPNPVFYAGAQSAVMHRFDPGRCLDYVERYGLTYLIGTPTNLQMLHDAQLRQPRDLGSLKGIVSMGAPLSREACLRCQEVLTPNISNGYGTTETFWNTFLRPFDLPAMAGTAGRSCTDDDVRVVRSHPDRPADPNEPVAKDGREIGEVIVRAPAKCTYTYINQPETARQVFRDGWMFTGDLGTWDAEEYVTIVRQKSDMIIAGGENIHPRQIEAVLCQHPSVLDAVAVGVPDEKWGQLVAAYVVPNDASLSAAELNRFCLHHPMLARYKRPRLYRFVAEVPLTSTGEKDRVALQEQARRELAAGLLQRP